MRALIKIRTDSIPHSWHLKTPCFLCKQYHKAKAPICDNCKHLLNPIIPAYNIKPSSTLDHVFAPYQFNAPLRALIHAYKYHDALYLSHFFAKEMLKTPPPLHLKKTCFIPIPLHKKRMYERGFNQSALLAQHLSKHCNKPCLLNAIKKTKHTPAQVTLSAKVREKNMRNAFYIQSKATAYDHIILIDDLITTGSTANELAKKLKKAGVSTVSLWCIAKTFPTQD